MLNTISLTHIIEASHEISWGLRAIDHPILGLKFSPIPKAKMYAFSQFQTKNSQFEIFFFWFSIFILYTYCYIFTISQNNRIQSHLLLSLHFLIVHYGKFNYWNQSSNGNVIHKEDVKFPNFSQNAANFPISMSPGPIPKKGCESPGS